MILIALIFVIRLLKIKMLIAENLMLKINIEASNLNPSAGESVMVLNNEGKVVEAHGSNQLNLNRIEEALIKLSDYFHRIHSMTRITLNRENKI